MTEEGMVKRMWFVVGEPGVGKTTVLSKAMRALQSEGFVVGGVVSREVRRSGVREGFELIDLSSNIREVLASLSQATGPRLGKYRVNLRGLAELAAPALLHALEHADVVMCDEVGPMELFSPEFRKAVKEVFSSAKPVIGAVHKKMNDPLVVDLKESEEAEVVEVTYGNRDSLPTELAAKVLAYLRRGQVG